MITEIEISIKIYVIKHIIVIKMAPMYTENPRTNVKKIFSSFLGS